MTSRRPYWCPQTKERRPCWCPQLFLRELIFILMQTFSSSLSFFSYLIKVRSRHCEKQARRSYLQLNMNVSRNGLLLFVQFVFTTSNNSLLFLVALRELSRELWVINYNLRKILGMTNEPFRGEGFGSCALKVD